jgi:hypothetical protein
VRPTETVRPADPGQRGLFALLREFADSSVDLAHNTAQMAASEWRVILHRFAIRLGLFVAALLVAAVGLLLVLVGAAHLLASVAGVDQWLGFVVVGAVTLATGAAFAVPVMRRLGERDLAFQATLAEFAEDIDVLRGRRGETEDDTP